MLCVYMTNDEWLGGVKIKIKDHLGPAPETPASCIVTARPNWPSQAQLGLEAQHTNIFIKWTPAYLFYYYTNMH